MNILVTGGTGYIGSICVSRLIELDHMVVVIDNLSTGHKETIPKQVTFYKGSIENQTLLKKIFNQHKIEVVIHFAAEATIGLSQANPQIYFHTNLTAGLILLKIMNLFSCRKIIFSSTASIFGNPKYLPVDENHPTQPINAYGLSKLMFEKVLPWYQDAYGLNYKIFRYFNAAGATKNLGENHNPETHLIPRVSEVALSILPKITICGNDYDTPDGTCIRDYVHVRDLVEAHILALNHWQGSHEYNLGNQQGFSVLQVIETAKKVTGCNIPVKIAPRRPGDPTKLFANSSLAKKELGWIPKHSKLEEIIKSDWLWRKKNFKK